MLGADHRAVTAHAGAAPERCRAAARWRRRALAGLALGGLMASPPANSPATAAEWFVGGSVSQGLLAETNRDFEPDGASPIYGTTTSLGLDFTALAPQTQVQVETGASFSAFGGDGDTQGLDGAFPNLAAAISHDGKYVDTGASVVFDYQPVAFAQLDDTGVTEGDATQLSMRLAGDAAYALDARNSLSLGGFGSIVRFPEGSTTLDPTTSYGASLVWSRAMTPATQGNVTFGASRFTSESIEDPDSLSFNLTAGAGHAVNGRLSFNANLGVSATRTMQTFFGVRSSDFSVGAIGNLDIAWQPRPDTGLVFALSHGLEPSSIGELQTTTAIGVGLSHAVNDWTSAGIDFLVQRQTSGGGFATDPNQVPRIYAAISPSIAFSLTRDWALRTGYTLRLQRESGSDAASNLVFMSITRQFDILR